MSNKYLARPDGWLYGAVMMNEPRGWEHFKNPEEDAYSGVNPYFEECKQYDNHLASIPKFTRHEGLSGIVEEGVDFVFKERFDKLTDEQYNSPANQNRDNPTAGYMVKVAVTLSPKQGEEKCEHIYETIICCKKCGSRASDIDVSKYYPD